MFDNDDGSIILRSVSIHDHLMANGKDALKHVLSNLSFSSIKFINEEIEHYWINLIPELKHIEIDNNIENPAQRVELFFANKSYNQIDNSPKIIILNQSITPEHHGQIILEASSGEDCARLLSISHLNAQRFSMPIFLIIANECLNEILNSKPEHIPLPPKHVIRDKSWSPDLIFTNHPALNFKRINYGHNKGPRDQAKLLIISHGKFSLLVNQLIQHSKIKNDIRHLELQTLRPISNEILNQAMKSVKKTVSLDKTYSWLESNNQIEPILMEQINDLIN